MDLIQQKFDIFSSRLADINDYHLFISYLAKTSYEDLLDQEEKFKKIEIEHKYDFSGSITRFYALDPLEDEEISIGEAIKRNSADDLYGLKFINNKQNQWLLVDAYEAFEEYLASVYALSGYTNKNLWNLSDYGNISLNEVNNLSLEWFEEKTHKTINSQKIIKQLKNKIPELNLALHHNKAKIDYNFRLSVVEHIRHIIVHNNGYIKDENRFIKEILDKIGKYNNGKYTPEHSDYIKKFYCNCSKKDGNIIYLNRVDLKGNDFGFRSYYDKFSKLIENLASYSIILNKSLNNHIKT